MNNSIVALALLALTACNQPQSTSAPAATLEKFTVEVPGIAYPTRSALQLKAVALYSDGTRVNVTNRTEWVTLDSTVGVIGASGIAQLNGVGLARYEGVFEGQRVPITIEVSGASLDSLTISSVDSGELARGDTRRFSARATYSDGTSLDVTAQTTWIADGVAVATTDTVGVVIGRAKGSGLLQASYFSQVSAIRLEVSAPRFASLSLNSPAFAVQPGDTHQLVLKAAFSDGSQRDVSALASWTSSDANVADLTAPGLVFARFAGQSRITATWENATASIELIVDPRQVTGVHFDSTDLGLAQGRTGGLDVMAEFADGSTMVVSASAQWSSSDLSIAEISAAGVVTTGSMGSTVITAKYAGIQATYDLVVTAPVLVSLDATLSGGRLLVGQTAQFIVSGTYSDGVVLNLSPVVTIRHGAGVSAGQIADRVKVTGLALGVAALELEVGGLVHEVTFEVSDAQLVGIEIHEELPRGWPLAGSTFEAPRGFYALATYADGVQLEVTELCTWSADDDTMATVSNQPGSRGTYDLSLGGQTHVRAQMLGASGVLSWDFAQRP